MKIPQPTGELLIALRLKEQMRLHFGIGIDAIEFNMGLQITRQILQGFIVLQTSEQESYKVSRPL